MNIPVNLIPILKSAASKLKGIAKRKFMAETVSELGRGAQRACESQLGWCRNTIRKGAHEINTGIVCHDNFAARGRKKSEDLNPHLLHDIKSIVDSDGHSQADPAMKSEKVYIKLTSNQIRTQLKEVYGYTAKAVPSESVMNRVLNENNYHLRKVRKTIPKKRYQRLTQSLKTCQ